MKKFLLLLIIPMYSPAQTFTPAETKRREEQAKRVTIIRDGWGIPHVYGKSDADAVFGLLYAQCEDDFKRVEMNYVEKLGRLSEINGERDLYNDLLIRMLIDTAAAIKDYNQSPPWLRKLMNAYADGINYYLFRNPGTKPALLKRFEPWYPMLWTDGSIGAIDIADVSVNELKNFYSGEAVTAAVVRGDVDPLPGGSNGFAIAPKKTASGNAILYINPHVTFYFRPEVSVQSEEGLHAYGAVTWGQFFIYQGFNEHLGWMHTSSYSDVADSYEEQVSKTENGFVYAYDGKTRPVKVKDISIQYSAAGTILSRTFKTYYTHHGPVMAKRNGRWISVRANNRDAKGLIQSWQRTKATDLASFTKTMELLANTSNNTVYADDKGNIAYWHGNFMPKRDTAYNWSKPVDGSTPATEWKGLHTLSELIQVKNPVNGFIQNCNSTPFTVSGKGSPAKENFPSYMAPNGENFRGINAVKVLNENSAYDIDKTIRSGYDTHLAAFDVLIPALLDAFQKKKNDTVYQPAETAIALLREWDRNSSETSIATTIAIEWAQRIWPAILRGKGADDKSDQVDKTKNFAATASAETLLNPLLATLTDLRKKFGDWRKPWGEINRYQRLTGELVEKFDDNKPSIACGFAASTWGCLPSFVSRTYAGTDLRYGYNGNSFICAVEFGRKVKAKSLLAGGESGDMRSKHFGDQAEMYVKGKFKDVLFYKDEVVKHAERTYHPGQ
ncbi:acylase [Sediminibacterium roseum]|uniref:Acylase n=1 Tax=Sediminibacterium roseum TaxID=1978412 RepID=A0ABW9ZNN0_9BACT|nr:penicillin acylase family protein [Sediminibacterium roseum]NCI48678.1 acylase [Sediminibacterium roseum]